MRFVKEAKPRRKRAIGLKRGTYICTEDNIPICNIYMETFSNKIRKSLIVRHFSKFGAIQQVKIAYGKTRRHAKRCTVCYKIPTAAKAALQQSIHTINYEAVTVKACPSWEQPFLENTESIANIHMSSSLLKLNDYCMAIVFGKLDLKEQLRLSLCHERLENVFTHMICPRKIKGFNFENVRGLTLWEIRQLFKSAGRLMFSIEITRIDCPSTSKHEAVIYAFMREFCTDVQRIQIVHRRFIFTSILNVLDTNYITELELYECNLYEGELVHLRILKNLHNLGLGRNRNILGLELCHLKKLQKLSLFGCTKVSQVNLIEICKIHPLRFLDARCMNDIRNWSTIVEHCRELETLKLSRIDCDGREGAESIARLPKLKKLEMQFFVRAMPSSFYDTLVDHHAEDLEELKITGNIYALFPTVGANIGRFKRLRVLWMGDNEYSSSKAFLKLIESLQNLKELNLNFSVRIKGDHILPLIKHCPKLKNLSLRYCKNITNDFIFKAISMLAHLNSSTRRTPLLVLVAGTCVKKNILKDPRYINANHLIRISFHIARAELGYLADKNEFDLADELTPDDPDTHGTDTNQSDTENGDNWSTNSLSDSSSDDEMEIFLWY